MTTIDLPYSCENYFHDCDYVSEDNHVIINDRKEIFRNGNLIQLPRECSAEYPKGRIISKDHFLLIDSDSPFENGNYPSNAWILNNKGKVEESMYLGSVHRIIILPNYIVASYSDVELYSNRKYATNGLVFFDLKGNSIFEYCRDLDRKERVRMLENYAFFSDSEDQVYFLPYPSFSIVSLHIKDRSIHEITKLRSPEAEARLEFWNPKGFLKKGLDWYFITPDTDNENSLFSRVFKMDSNKRIEEIDRCCFSHSPQGHPNGRFVIPNHRTSSSYKKCQVIEL